MKIILKGLTLSYSSSKRSVSTCMVGHTFISHHLNCLTKKKCINQDKHLIDNKIIIYVIFMKDHHILYVY
jgi:hypothetical protein